MRSQKFRSVLKKKPEYLSVEQFKQTNKNWVGSTKCVPAKFSPKIASLQLLFQTNKKHDSTDTIPFLNKKNSFIIWHLLIYFDSHLNMNFLKFKI